MSRHTQCALTCYMVLSLFFFYIPPINRLLRYAAMCQQRGMLNTTSWNTQVPKAAVQNVQCGRKGNKHVSAQECTECLFCKKKKIHRKPLIEKTSKTSKASFCPDTLILVGFSKCHFKTASFSLLLFSFHSHEMSVTVYC